MPLRELWLQEHQTLRQEVISVKECQVGILKWAYGILGGILAFAWGLVLTSGDQPFNTVLITTRVTPATIALLMGSILGSFMVQIIVHKTRSAFRMCGYIRLLEGLLSQNGYPGYETAFQKLREIQRNEGAGTEVEFRETWKEFVNDWKQKLGIKIKAKINKRHARKESASLSGKYYRRIAFQIHFLSFFALASAFFLLLVDVKREWWHIALWALFIVSAGFWSISVVRCTALTRMQEVGDHSIDGQYKLWCRAFSKCGYTMNP